MPAKFELIAPCFFGCEATAKFELTRIGAENIRVEDGRLSFCGGAEMIAAANLNLRTVERVMLLLARYKATTFDELFDGVYSIPWEEFLPADAAFPVTGSSLNSQLTSIPELVLMAEMPRSRCSTWILPAADAARAACGTTVPSMESPMAAAVIHAVSFFFINIHLMCPFVCILVCRHGISFLPQFGTAYIPLLYMFDCTMSMYNIDNFL